MFRRPRFVVTALFAAALLITGSVALTHAAQSKPHDQAAPHEHKETGTGGWTLPPDAEQKKNPLADDPKALAQGKTVFKSKCQKCHGATGLGDGPDADPDHQEDMDLTNASRAVKNPDGVMFYKVSNGRKSPKMPAFKDQLNEQQIWAVVAYARSLRK